MADDNAQDIAVNFPLKVTTSRENPDGTVELNIEYSEDFKQWFMEREGLKRWSHQRFRKVIGPLVEQYLQGTRSDDT